MGEFPNKATQFTTENQPKNGGRPKGSRSMKTILREYLENISINIESDEIIKSWAKDQNISAKELLVLDDIKTSIYGDSENREKSKKRIWEYLEGKPDQHQVLEVKQPQTKAEIQSELEKYAKRAGLSFEEYCLREGIELDQFDELKQIESGD